MKVQIHASSMRLPDDLFNALCQEKADIKLTINGVEFPLSITQSEHNLMSFGVSEVISTFRTKQAE